MKIGLIDVDGHNNFPNLALMKLSKFYKSQGATVEFYNGFDWYDKVFMSKIFTFTPDYGFYINADQVEKGGTGYNLTNVLPSDIDSLQPDYSLYNVDNKAAFGFLSRGCCNSCKWCVVPKKEGKIKPYMDIEEIAIEGRNRITLMDNNILASDYGFTQIEKIISMNLRVDFNQGLDARKIDLETAKLLARVKWLNYIRLACDVTANIKPVQTAIDNLRQAGYKGFIFIYCLLNESLEMCYNRIMYFRNQHYIVPFAQPYRDFVNKNVPPQWQIDLAHWTNKRSSFLSVDFLTFSPRKNFHCKQYFQNN